MAESVTMSMIKTGNGGDDASTLTRQTGATRGANADGNDNTVTTNTVLSNSEFSSSNSYQRAQSRRDNNLNLLSTTNSDFKGKQKDFDGVIGLREEMAHLKHGKLIKEFVENLLNYALQNYKRGNDLRPLLEERQDPFIKLEGNKPKIKEMAKDA